MYKALSPQALKYKQSMVPDKVLSVVNDHLSKRINKGLNGKFSAKLYKKDLYKLVELFLDCDRELIIANRWFEAMIPFYEEAGWKVSSVENSPFDDEEIDEYFWFQEK